LSGKVEVRKVLAGGEEWQSVEGERMQAIAHALSDPVRCAILRVLEDGPIRQLELVSALSKVFSKSYGSAHVRYHLRLLQKAGLVGAMPDPANPRGKVIYKAADFRLQVRPREQPSLQKWVPRTAEEFVAGLKEILGRGEK
jgi:DNA-binding transcriptional ArsR family regulator